MTRLTAALAVLLVLLAGCAGSRPGSEPPDPAPLILIGIDGFRHDYFARAPTPTLQRLIAEGARAERLVPVFPTKTFPNHYTLVTGLYPEHHGIVDNTMYDAATGKSFSLGNTAAMRDSTWWGGEPVWVTAEKQGLRAATLFWPGSEARIGNVRPSYWKPYDGDMPYLARVDTILKWLDLPAERRPTLLTLYFSAVDSQGHAHGPESPETAAAIARVDSALAHLVVGLKARNLYDQTNLVLVSDHGMADMSSDRVVYADDYADLETPSERVFWSETTGIWPKAGKTDSLYAALVAAGIPHVQVYRREDMPARLHYRDNPRIPPIVLLLDEGWSLTTRERAQRRPLRATWGAHGFDNAYDSMGGILLARGPAFRQGVTVAPVSAVNVYALLTQVLGLQSAPHDGDAEAIQALLR